MLWVILSTTLRRPCVLGILQKDTQYIRHGERRSKGVDISIGAILQIAPVGTANLLLPEMTLSADFLMKVFWRSILRTIVKSTAFLSF